MTTLDVSVAGPCCSFRRLHPLLRDCNKQHDPNRVSDLPDDTRPGGMGRSRGAESVSVVLLVAGGRPGCYLDRPLRRESRLSRPAEGLSEPSEHHKVGVEGYSVKPANAERCQSVLMFQNAELALAGCSSSAITAACHEPLSEPQNGTRMALLCRAL
jgi:hypothetical protein